MGQLSSYPRGLPAPTRSVRYLSEMPATITIERVANPWADRLRRYKIEINGQLSGSISRGEELSIDAPAGRVEVRARIDWSGSNTWVGDLADGDRVTLVVGHNDDQLTGIFSKNRYLSLKPK